MCKSDDYKIVDYIRAEHVRVGDYVLVGCNQGRYYIAHELQSRGMDLKVSVVSESFNYADRRLIVVDQGVCKQFMPDTLIPISNRESFIKCWGL